MPQFTPWTVTDPTPNVLFNPIAAAQAAQTYQSGQLAQQSARQQIGATNMEMVGRAAGSLLNMSESDAAAAYPGMVADLQSQGFAPNAPPDYPGHARLQAMVQSTIPIAQQYQYGILTAPGVTDAINRATAPLTPSSGGGSGGAGTGGTAAGGGSFMDSLAAIESGDKNIVSGVDPDNQGRTLAQGGNASEISQGNFQINTATWRDFAKQAGVDINQYPNAMSAPRAVQAQVASVIPFNRFGPRTQALMRTRFGPLDTSQTVGALAGTPALAFNPNTAGPRVTGIAAAPPSNPNAGPRVAAVPSAAPAAGLPVASATAPVDPNAPLPVPPIPPPAGDPAPANMAAPVPVTPSPIAARTGGTDMAGPGAGPDTMPAVAAPNRMYDTGIPGIQINGPGNALAPPPVATQAPPPAAAASQPTAGQPPATGQNSPQFQAAMELNRRAQALDMVVDPTGRTKALAASLRAQAQLYMQADSVSYDPVTGIGTKALTGERLNAAAPNAHYVWDDKQGAYIDTSGTHPPVTPPSPRMTVTPEGDVIQAMPGGGVRVVSPADPAAIAARAAAQAQGTGVGGDVARQLPALAQQGRDSAQAIGNIDYGMSQLAKAQQAGITTGYFTPALVEAQSALKSIGIPTDKVPFINVDPSAIGNIQTARKTLLIVSSAILHQALGEGSQITDAKIDHFIHAQPGIDTDPQALSRVLNWARSQFVYENEQSKAAVTQAASSPTGTLPLNWQAQYYRDHGFAPIYDRGSGEMQQPDGQSPGRQPPPGPPPMAPVNPSNRVVDTTYTTPKGALKWTGTGWVSP